MERVVITGMGAVCGNASDKEELYRACVKGVSGIRKCGVFGTEGLLTDKFGECVKIGTGNRLKKLIALSGGEMLADSGYRAEDISAMGGRCRLFYGTLLSTADFYYNHSLEKAEGKPCGTSLAEMNNYAAYAKKLFGVRGGMSTSSAACASGTTAVGMAFDYVRNGLCETAIAGGADPLTVIAAYGFNSLKSLSGGVCNPYDESRDGINIGECGAFFFLETLERARKRGAKIYCEVCGYGLSNDAYHITSPAPDGGGAYAAMLSALRDGGVSAEDIDYINGHGTGTEINDSMEIKAVLRLFEGSGKVPALSSTKALIGHCMGASGAIELASVIMAMKNNKYIPMPKIKNPIDTGGRIFISDKTRDTDIRYALSNSFAFAGNCASILIKKYEGGETR
ncbi:MAG: beta-ketoacyl-[acyl-carrier-protein] synthase family protein [Ruminococcus sp.]|nr:beta-ketoacyl-[acyl-carrier-protein] synthase family protein [Ruminococcus sp.]MCM1381277.1 beta-ketoacyl-[acyl-carrier-protein] synthase family protein [Muribaculaceae bacterium]MCM1478500.1 beta-ketoacyl-[acyl-carrier-protein] synthase family protein [Muribaculaceae bacterium]